MAARIRKTHQDEVRAKHYVYELFDADGTIMYVGKGSGRRFDVQKKKYCLDGRIVQWFGTEAKAYSAEISHIAKVCPPLNKVKGGNGCRTAKTRIPKWQAVIEAIGTRIYAARLLLAFGVADKSKIDEIRQVAYGCRC